MLQYAVGLIAKEKPRHMVTIINGTISLTLLAIITEHIVGTSYDAMCWAVACGIVEGGDGGTLSPNAGITRAQAAAIFMRYAEL